MSAYVVNDATINVLVGWAALNKVSYFRESMGWTAVAGSEQGTADALYSTNVRSFDYRYKQGPSNTDFKYKADKRALTISAVHILSLCACLSYQSNELPDWEKTLAWTIIQAIKEAAIRALPGYQDAPWGL